MAELKIKVKEAEGVKWAAIGMLLKDQGFQCIVAGFEGSGDSGAIEYLVATPEDFKTVCDSADYYEYEGDSELVKDVIEHHAKFIEDHCYEVLDKIDDWVNNDGGYGFLVIDVINNKHFIDSNIRITNVENFEYEGKIEPI